MEYDIEYVFDYNDDVGSVLLTQTHLRGSVLWTQTHLRGHYHDFIDKLNSGYNIRKITFELNEEVDITGKEYYLYLNRFYENRINIIDNSLIYYNNTISFYCTPFLKYKACEDICIVLSYDISYKSHILKYKSCRIILNNNNSLKIKHLQKNDDDEKYLLIQSNYFKNEYELKQYIISWTDDIVPSAYDYFLKNLFYIVIIFKDNTDNLVDVLYKKN